MGLHVSERGMRAPEKDRKHLERGIRALERGIGDREIGKRDLERGIGDQKRGISSCYYHFQKFPIPCHIPKPQICFFYFPAYILYCFLLIIIPDICYGSHGNTRVNFFGRCKFLQIYREKLAIYCVNWQFTV